MMIADNVDALLRAVRSAVNLRTFVLVPKDDAKKLLQFLEAVKKDMSDAERCCTNCINPPCLDCPRMVLDETMKVLQEQG